MLDFTTTQAQPKAEDIPVDYAALVNVRAELHEAYENLSEEIQNLDCVKEVVANVTKSIDLLKKFGNPAVEQLDLNGELSSILNAKDGVLTAETSIQKLADYKVTCLESFKETAGKILEQVKRILIAIVNFFKSVIGSGVQRLRRTGENLQKKAQDAQNQGVKELVAPSENGSATEAFTITDAGWLAKYGEVLQETLQSIMSITDHISKAMTSFVQITKSTDTVEMKRLLDAFLHTDASYLTKADDALRAIEAKKDDFTWDRQLPKRLSCDAIYRFGESTKPFADTYEVLSKRSESVANDLSEALKNQSSERPTTDEELNDMVLTAKFSCAKIMHRYAALTGFILNQYLMVANRLGAYAFLKGTVQAVHDAL